MKYSYLISILALSLFLGACAQEAYYADREHGIASNNAFDQQIVHKDYKYAKQPVEGMEGIYSENIMGKYLDTYKTAPTSDKIDINSMGLSSQ
jgi:hypothetical protein